MNNFIYSFQEYLTIYFSWMDLYKCIEYFQCSYWFDLWFYVSQLVWPFYLNKNRNRRTYTSTSVHVYGKCQFLKWLNDKLAMQFPRIDLQSIKKSLANASVCQYNWHRVQRILFTCTATHFKYDDVDNMIPILYVYEKISAFYGTKFPFHTVHSHCI